MTRVIYLLTILLSLILAGTASARIEGELLKSLVTEGAPLDVAVAPDGRRIYVLTDGGNLLIYSREGELEERISVGKGVDGLEVLPGGDQLLLRSRKDRALKIMELAFIQVIDTEGDPFQGPEDAPVTIVVFDDFQCPFCAKLAPQLKEVMALYPGKTRLVFKQFPLNSHPFARKAALASLAAFRQGKFWEYHDLLFANFNRLNDQMLRELAVQAGLDMKRFEADLGAREVWAALNRDLQGGVAAGVRGTPTVFVNGRLLKEHSMEAFRRAIDSELGAES